MVDEFDVAKESAFSREKLDQTIPNRLRQLMAVVELSANNLEDWYGQLVVKLLLAALNESAGLRKTMDEENLSGAAWNARNCLELWIWAEYCSRSRENAWRFHSDALRDMKGISEAYDAICQAAGITNDFKSTAQTSLNKAALERLNLESLDSNYMKVLEAAKTVNLEGQFAPWNKYLSKLAHPTAGLVVGLISGRLDSSKGLQTCCTTTGMYFAGQIVMVLERIVAEISGA
jgi:hypothetical protein